MQFVLPGPERLSGYVAALQRGWSADMRGEEGAREELARIVAAAAEFLPSMAEMHEVPVLYAGFLSDLAGVEELTRLERG